MAREREQRKSSDSSMRDRARKEAEKRGQRGGSWSVVQAPEGVTFFKAEMPQGKDQVIKRLDVMPFELTIDNYKEMKKGDQWYEFTYYTHEKIGVDNATRLCPTTFGDPCPICEKRQQMLDKGIPYNDPAVKALKKKERQLFNVIELDGEDKNIKLWDISYHLFGRQLEEELRSQDPEVAGFAELSGGYTLSVRFGLKSIPAPDGTPGKPFSETKRIDFKERKDYKENMLDEAIDLASCLVVTSYEKLRAEFMEEDTDDTDAGQSSEKESPRGRSRRDLEPEPEKEKPKERSRRDPEPEPEPTRTRERGRREPEPEKKKLKDECPLPKGEFGVDNDIHDGCRECPSEIWDACAKEYDRIKKEKKK